MRDPQLPKTDFHCIFCGTQHAAVPKERGAFYVFTCCNYEMRFQPEAGGGINPQAVLELRPLSFVKRHMPICPECGGYLEHSPGEPGSEMMVCPGACA